MLIVVGVDGSLPSRRAVEWCAQHAAALGAEVVAVHSIELPAFVGAAGFGAIPVPVPYEPDHDEVRAVMQRDWCACLADSGINYRLLVSNGPPAETLMNVAEAEGADLVVTGRRGLGGFGELLLGSTTHHLSHHLGRPLLIVP